MVLIDAHTGKLLLLFLMFVYLFTLQYSRSRLWGEVDQGFRSQFPKVTLGLLCSLVSIVPYNHRFHCNWRYCSFHSACDRNIHLAYNSSSLKSPCSSQGSREAGAFVCVEEVCRKFLGYYFRVFCRGILEFKSRLRAKKEMKPYPVQIRKLILPWTTQVMKCHGRGIVERQLD